ncbi:hypothetical protein HUZ38_21330 [Klebsiella pneumoniae]|uniref:hypothetical protein n=1 Tax=Klebsiella pneumoniae TaxID=573 RepID=UPI001330FC21|nr:hypothetical protein [Klebsiella pneumoniae]ULI71272.1 hypothetical protein HUZ38_21330 [Klebsiella pneumoniae]HBR2275483.1 hypothetical protein [Klebsiella pneumoniae]
MPNISSEESTVIEDMFSWCPNDLSVIKKALLDVKNSEGLYQEVVKHKGNLYSLKSDISEATGLNLKVSGELGRELWFVVKQNSDRERMLKNGIVYGIWIHEGSLCKYPEHEKLNGRQFPIKKGVKMGVFKRILPAQLIGCKCMIKPVLSF